MSGFIAATPIEMRMMASRQARLLTPTEVKVIKNGVTPSRRMRLKFEARGIMDDCEAGKLTHLGILVKACL